MKKTDKRIDSYIHKSADFAKPVLSHLRDLVHTACPDVQETMKWSFPHFDYKNEMMCSMAAFKNHCAFGFWKASLMRDANNILSTNRNDAMGHFGRITSLKDLPPDRIILKYVKEAMDLNDKGVKIAKPKPIARKDIKIPKDLSEALRKNKEAFQTFESFSPSHVREYVEWISDAKTADTRSRRLSAALEWMTAGKSRNWKYAKK